MKRVLSVDGGGIRGLVPAALCEKWETWAGCRIHELFDLMVGTSTGGLLAMGLSIPPHGKRASELVAFYMNEGPKIFRRPRGPVRYVRGAKYGNAALIKSVSDVFGQHRMSDAIVDLLITTYDIKSGSPIYLKRRRSAESSAADYLMSEVAIATSAAPTYFPPAALWNRVLVDGGLVANNPANLAYAEAKRLWPEEEVLLVSLGTGILTQPRWLRDAVRWGSANWAAHIIDVMFDGTARATEDFFRYAHPEKYWRFQTGLSEATSALDNASEASLLGLRKLGDDMARTRENELIELAKLLKKTGSLRATIESPEASKVVPPGECRVTGTVTGHAGENLYLLTGSEGLYWPSARLIPRAGKWQGHVNFGRRTPKATIRVVAADEALSGYIEFYRSHQIALRHPGMPVARIPRELASQEVVVDLSQS